jgi:hypothetical protein
MIDIPFDKGTKIQPNNLLWHKTYDGSKGYMISSHKSAINEKDIYFNYSVSLYANSEKIRVVNEKGIT